MGTEINNDLAKEFELIRLAQADVNNFEILYDRYYSLIFVFILKKIGNNQMAAEICSNVFYKALMNLKGYKFKGLPFSSWLYRIAINEVNLFYRKQKICNEITIEQSDLIHFLHELETSDTIETQKALLVAIQKLKAGEIQLIELRYFQDLSFKEIAAICEITETNAKVKVYRILHKLKEILTKLLH